MSEEQNIPEEEPIDNSQQPKEETLQPLIIHVLSVVCSKNKSTAVRSL